MRQAPGELDALYISKLNIDEVFGNGLIYDLPTLPRSIPMDTTGLGDATGLPMICIVDCDAWTGITPPSGWTQVFSWYDHPTSSHSGAVWTLDSWGGESFTGQATTTIPLGISGANFRILTTLLVGATPGRFTAAMGTHSTSMVLTDPGGTYRLQAAASQIRYDRTFSPTLPSTMRRYNDMLYHGTYLNGAPDFGAEGWFSKAQTDAMLKDQVIGVGTYAPNIGGSTVPINIWWTG